MAKLEDYGIRVINHGQWGDPEMEWKKSNFQTLLFNYWDCIECFENEDYDLSREEDISLLTDYLHELRPNDYARPEIDYEWSVWTGARDVFNDASLYDDSDYYKDHTNQKRGADWVLHTAGQALRQALEYVWEDYISNCEISVYRNDGKNSTLVALYILQGSTLRNVMSYKK